MADRTLTAGVATETGEARTVSALFARFAFDSGTTFLWSGIGALTTAAMGTLPAATWQGLGTLGAVSAIEETSELRATGLTFTLSGVPSALIATALGEHYQGRAVTLWAGFFDDAGALIADPVQVFAGRMDQMEVVEAGETAAIRVSAENRLIDLERVDQVRHYTPDDQKKAFPGDKGLDYVPAMQELVVVWGRHALEPSKAGRSGGSPASTGGGATRPPNAGGGGGPGRSGPAGDRSSRGDRGE